MINKNVLQCDCFCLWEAHLDIQEVKPDEKVLEFNQTLEACMPRVLNVHHTIEEINKKTSTMSRRIRES